MPKADARPALNTSDWASIRETLGRAAVRGTDPAEALHEAGYALTPAVSRQIQVQQVREIVLTYRTWSPPEFLARLGRGSAAATPSDMYRAIGGWLDEILAAKIEAYEEELRK